jgi:DNA-binding transcriptional LysR family regulator
VELRQLRYFTVLAAELSFTRAARRLHVSQPPLSYQIANLEAELGARLFHRTSRSVQLSEAGKALLPHALAVLERVEEARGHVRRVAHGLEGRVKVGLAASHFLGPFPYFIREFRSRRPGVEVMLHEMRPADHLRELREGRLDLSVTRAAPPDPQLEALLLWRDPVVLAVPLHHPLAARRRVRLAGLQDEDFVFLKLDSSAFAQRLFEACVAAGFSPRIVQHVVEIPAALNLVAAGLGVALVPASLAKMRSDAVAICTLGRALQSAVTGDVYLLRRAGEQPAAVHEFAEALRHWARARPPRSAADPGQPSPRTAASV